MSDYDTFLKEKAIFHPSTGIENPPGVSEKLFGFQRDIVRWALQRGRACIFAGTGLGKTAMQCEWASRVAQYINEPVLILAPLAVSSQTVSEAARILGVKIVPASDQSDVGDEGIYITNYQKLHRFEPMAFGGVVLDESSIIKHEDGKFRQLIIDQFRDTPFRLACTATPAPNDFMEIGNHSEFMGAMSMSEMLSTFFVHDGGETQKWRLKKHAESDFWRWMASWSVCVQKPSDLGYPNEGYDLPELRVHEHIIQANMVREGELFGFVAATMQERKQARRGSLGIRVDAASDLANSSDEQWGVWCNLNDESAALASSIKGSVQVTGSDSDEYKSSAMMDFAAGKIRVLISKPSICGFGMNWQQCRNTMFVGLSDSFEQYYQAVRRFWRFGQKREVNAHIVISDSEGSILRNIKRKEKDAEAMQRNLIAHMAEFTKKEFNGLTRSKLDYLPQTPMTIPRWLQPSIKSKV